MEMAKENPTETSSVNRKGINTFFTEMLPFSIQKELLLIITTVSNTV